MANKKTVTFTDKDSKLISGIERYQKEKKLSSFVAAVRVLCNDALQLKKISK